MSELPASAPSPVETVNPERRTVVIQKHLLTRNALQAQENRSRFQASGTAVLNLLSSPGSGKTALLERTLSEFGRRYRLGVFVGDLQTENDARRLEGRGAPIVSITTGGFCHLEAEMVSLACAELATSQLDLLVIENVGNLVCPASFDLGEDARVVLLSTTEGEDKPLKYPKAFRTAQLVVITKMDLADAVDFDRNLAIANIRSIAPAAQILELSAKRDQGMEAWYAWLEALVKSQAANKSGATAPHLADRAPAASHGA
jgi:hydrogenase nickel incorporation protein HypB